MKKRVPTTTGKEVPHSDIAKSIREAHKSGNVIATPEEIAEIERIAAKYARPARRKRSMWTGHGR